VKGLKELVEQALDGTEQEAPPPVEISDEARYALAVKMREWSGWRDGKVVFGKPDISPWAMTDHNTRTFTLNADPLILNPHRVLLTVTPFRLRQEAVLTGVMLHEAGHARHTLWRPRTHEAQAAFVHGPESPHAGEPVNNPTMRLAVLMEEARIEGLMARSADNIGARGLEWTLRASSAKLTPMTDVSTNPDQQVMDLISSWALRSAKRLAIHHWDPHHTIPPWVGDLTSLLNGVLTKHITDNETDPFAEPVTTKVQKVISSLLMMAVCVDDRGTYMVDTARDVLDILFPETPPEDQPEAGEGCTAQPGDAAEESDSESGDDGEGDEEGEGGEGNTDPEDEGSGDDPGAGDSGDDDADPDKPDDGEPDESDKGGDGDEVSDESDTGESEAQPESPLAKALRALEQQAQSAAEDEAEEDAEKAEQEGGTTGGEGGEGTDGNQWRLPSREEREIQKGAERFLRKLIEPNEQSKVTLTDQPSSMVDGAALSEWKAGGQQREPHFFKRTRRSIEPSPPVKIAILADVSGSMDELQKPTAVLSWALSAAALDLRNFAGRGQQIESCLIHWGSRAEVIQAVGQQLRGIREYECYQGTDAMAEAFDLVEEQMPGFFDLTDKPVNRLLVQFTDWDLSRWSGYKETGRGVARLLAAGVNMLSVVPKGYSTRRTALPEFLQAAREQRGRNSLIKYNPMFPGQVWDTAAELLEGGAPAPFAGF
jgi:hypothetical protein